MQESGFELTALYFSYKDFFTHEIIVANMRLLLLKR